MSKISRFLNFSVRDKGLFLEAVVFHLWIGLLLKMIPFRWIPRFFAGPKPKAQSPESKSIQLIRMAIERAGRVSPWKNRCLVSSLAGKCMLRRRKISSRISLGMAKDANGKMTAHAWLVSGDVEIIPSGNSFHELFNF